MNSKKRDARTRGIPLVVAVLGWTFAITASGCATFARATAPAEDGRSIYVVGQYDDDAAVWRCPKTPGDCTRLEVVYR